LPDRTIHQRRRLGENSDPQGLSLITSAGIFAGVSDVIEALHATVML